MSRKKGFSKTRLGEVLAEAGIEYTHLRAWVNRRTIGSPSGRPRRSGAGALRGLQRSKEATDLDRLAANARASRGSVLSFEKDESRCHRQVVLETGRSRASVPVNPLA
ncbi:DUF488 domain-containing protein [Streptomyces sp. SM12]|uniref:DUF488 domain-containing protein n=1 Tax=Streptomyces sp. SM12 TaxID=1071602 RepID=UPI0035B697FA